jgi:hypothetical protein
LENVLELNKALIIYIEREKLAYFRFIYFIFVVI